VLYVPAGTRHNVRAGAAGLQLLTAYTPLEPGQFEHPPTMADKVKPH
jgi:mannose-6-phosphate isomerase-like protein (cupin superfamily)